MTSSICTVVPDEGGSQRQTASVQAFDVGYDDNSVPVTGNGVQMQSSQQSGTNGVGVAISRSRRHDAGSDVAVDDVDSEEVLLRRVLTDVRRAYCRQPAASSFNDEDLSFEKQNTSTEFARQLAQYSTTAAATDTMLTSSSSSAAAAFAAATDSDQLQLSISCAADRQPNNSSHATSCIGIASSTPLSTSSSGSSALPPTRPRSAVESSALSGAAGGSSAFASASSVGGGRNYAVGRDVRVSLRPRRAVSLDRPVSLPPFLRPIEEEDGPVAAVTQGPIVGRTPTEKAIPDKNICCSTRPSSTSPQPPTTPVDADGSPVVGINKTGSGCQTRRKSPSSPVTERPKETATRARQHQLQRPTTICCEPDFDDDDDDDEGEDDDEEPVTSCFDSDDDCRCIESSSRKHRTAERFGRQTNFGTLQQQQKQQTDATNGLLDLRLSKSICSRSVLWRRPAAPYGTKSSSFSTGKVSAGSCLMPLSTATSVSPLTAATEAPTRRQNNVPTPTSPPLPIPTSLLFYILMTSLTGLLACLTAASPLFLVAIVAITSLMTYPFAKL